MIGLWLVSGLALLEPTDAEAGLHFGPKLPAREHAPLREKFEELLPAACSPPPCTEDCGPDDTRLSAEIRGAERSYSLRWQLDDPRLPAPFIHESTCELCSLVEVGDQIATDLASVCARLETLDGALAQVEISSAPTNAVVFVDGRRVGRSPWFGELETGTHTVELHARGYRNLQQTVELDHAGPRREQFELSPGRPNSRPYWPAWLGLAFGVAAGVAGSAMIAIHDKPWAGRCSGADVDINGNCRFVYRTRPVGIALTAVGVGLAGAGVGLMVWAQRGPQTVGHAHSYDLGLGWQGRF